MNRELQGWIMLVAAVALVAAAVVGIYVLRSSKERVIDLSKVEVTSPLRKPQGDTDA